MLNRHEFLFFYICSCSYKKVQLYQILLNDSLHFQPFDILTILSLQGLVILVHLSFSQFLRESPFFLVSVPRMF